MYSNDHDGQVKVVNAANTCQWHRESVTFKLELEIFDQMLTRMVLRGSTGQVGAIGCSGPGMG
jgi:hypothetical protein